MEVRKRLKVTVRVLTWSAKYPASMSFKTNSPESSTKVNYASLLEKIMRDKK